MYTFLYFDPRRPKNLPTPKPKVPAGPGPTHPPKLTPGGSSFWPKIGKAVPGHPGNPPPGG